MQLESMLFREMKEYDNQMLRTYRGNASPTNLRDLELATEGGRSVSASAMSGLAGRIIRPEADTDRVAAIVGGWGEQKLMFAMRVVIRQTNSSVQYLEISGFTDHMGATESVRGVHLDERMTLHFTSVTRVNRSQADTSRGTRWITSILKSNDVLSAQTNMDFTRAQGAQGTITVRPEDIFTKKTTAGPFAKRVEREGGVDGRPGFPTGAMKLSNRLNGSPSRYLARSMHALTTADNGDNIIDNYGIDRDTTKIFKDARGQVREEIIVTDPFFEELSRDTNVLQDGFITLGELMQMNPDFDFDTVPVYFTGKGQRKSLRGDYTPWNGSDNETVAATILVNALPMYMVNHQIASLSFTATNQGTMGDMVVLPDNVFAMAEGPEISEITGLFCQRIASEILLDMLPYNDCMLDLEVDTSTAGETYIKISLDGGAYEEYVFPTFAQSVVSPVLSEDRSYMDGMASTITQIVESIGANNTTGSNGSGGRIINPATKRSF